MNISSSNSGHSPRPQPVTTDEKLDSVIKRLGRIERDLIDIREHLRVPRRRSGNRQLVPEDNSF